MIPARLEQDQQVEISRRLIETGVFVIVRAEEYKKGKWQPKTNLFGREKANGGSGFIATEEGWIMTCAHVVRKALEEKKENIRISIDVRLSDGKLRSARVIGFDKSTDMALLEADGIPRIPPLAFADSDTVETGWDLMTYGHPFGLGATISDGIVSGRESGIVTTDDGTITRLDMIQTNAVLNPGNSGGAVVDRNGRLIGMAGAIISGISGTNIGIGFFAASNNISQFIKSVRSRRANSDKS